jgi:putative endonuclease
MLQPSYVYILASARNGTLYIGVTTDLVKRCYEHKNGTFKGFTSRYKVCRLVHYEVYEDVINAIAREKALKKWGRAWKLELIEKSNPEWADLYSEIIR